MSVMKTIMFRKAALKNVSINEPGLPSYNISRFVHTQYLTKNIQYISNDKIRLCMSSKSMKLNQNLDKPLCVLLKWLMAKPKHVIKYANLYLEQGFDVLSVGCTPWQLMWPVKGSQLVAADLLKFMSVNESFSPLVLHGFSVGGYLWGELCLQTLADVDVYHMKLFYDSSTVHYERSSRVFQYNPCHAPALILVSDRDPISPQSTRRKMADSWTSVDILCTTKVFENSLHVQHFSKYPKEYLSALHDHLKAVNLLPHPEKTRI